MSRFEKQGFLFYAGFLVLVLILSGTGMVRPYRAYADMRAEDLEIITGVFSERGRDFARIQDWKSSAGEYRKALVRDPDNTDVLFGLGYALYRQHEQRAAKDHLRKALSLDPSHIPSRLWLGMILLQEKDLRRARKEFERLLEADEIDPRTYFGLASVHEVLYRTGGSTQDKEFAERYFEHYLRTVRGTPGPGTEYTNKARACILELKYGELGRLFNQAVASYQRGEYASCSLLLDRALEMNPGFQKAHVLKARLCSTAGSPLFDPELRTCIEILKNAPDEADARCMLGSLYSLLGKGELARANLQAALRLDPESQKALNLMAELHYKAGDMQKAMDAYRRSKALNPESPEGRKAKVELNVMQGFSRGTLVLYNHAEEKRQKIESQGVVQDVYLTARLNGILERIVRRNHFPYLWEKYSLKIINNPSLQAYSLPGGHIYINIGLIQHIRDAHQDADDLLAFIIGHEIAHIERDHVIARLRHVEALGTRLDVLLRVRTVLAEFQRSDEIEADCLGTQYAYLAGYDPFSGSRFLEEMLKRGDYLDSKDSAVIAERLQRIHGCLGELKGTCGYFEQGLDLLSKDDYKGAQRAFENFLIVFPGDSAARNNMAVALHRRALCCKKPALWWKTSDIEPIRLRAMQRRQRAKTTACTEARCEQMVAEAERQFKILLASNPRDEAALNNLANLYHDLGKLDEAKALYEEALSLNPNYTDARNNCGVLLCEMRQYEAGIGHLEASVLADPTFIPAYYNLGKAYFKLGNDAEAIVAWDEYLKRDKGSNGWVLRAKRFSSEAQARLAKSRSTQ